MSNLANLASLTFAIIKPDAVRGGKTGSIIQRILDGGFSVRAMKMLHMTLREAEGFYAIHRERPFFSGLTEFMSSGPCVVMVLKKNGAVRAWRDLMGATDPAKADSGTLRERMLFTALIRMRTPQSKSPTSSVRLRLFDHETLSNL